MDQSNATISSGHSSGYGDSFSPEIDLSLAPGQTVYVAYQYLGSPNGPRPYQIDNVKMPNSLQTGYYKW